jgi:hypothetical protein
MYLQVRNSMPKKDSKVMTQKEMASMGGNARKEKLSAKELTEQARHAVNTRWKRVRQEQAKKR